jgi:hypothetical protein
MTDTKNKKNLLWQQALEKMDADQLLSLLTDIRDTQQSVDQCLAELESGIGLAIERHVAVAFAGGDAEGHRRAHETMIAMMEEKRRMYANLKDKTLSALVWVLLVWLGYTVLNGVRHALGLPPT